MTGYIHVNLKEMIKEIGEDKVKGILSTFLCPANKDVERFLLSKSIEFANQSIAATHLVFTSYKGNPVLIGYFTLTNKSFFIAQNALSNSMRRRLSRFAERNDDLKGYYISAPLIAQLSKNFANGYDKLITGDELLKIACDKIRSIQIDLSGKVIYLECDDNKKLLDFYCSNGFFPFAKRNLDKHEQAETDSKYLVQLIKYVKG